MLRIRLIRTGKKNQVSFRVVLTEKTSASQGKFQEILGYYNPRLKKVDLKKDRILHWLSKGAQASVTVHNLLVKHKIIEGKKIIVKIKSKPQSKAPAVDVQVGQKDQVLSEQAAKIPTEDQDSKNIDKPIENV